jgi:hypothetical protein
VDDPLEIRIVCDDPARIVGVLNRLIPTLPADVRNRANTAKLQFLVEFGTQGLYDRVNGRTVGQLIADGETLFTPPQVEASGEQDGVRWQLVSAPRPKADG